MSVDEQSTTPGSSSTLTAVLAGSIGSVIATGVLYFVGGAYYDGYSRALGLDFLAGLQPTGYIFYGAQFLIDLSIRVAALVLVGVLAAVWVAQKGIPLIPKGRFSLQPEYRLVVGLLTAGASFLLRLPLLASMLRLRL